MDIELTPQQKEIAEGKAGKRVFLTGIAGSGKTSAASARLRFLLEQDIDPRTIMVLVPQRTLGLPYYDLTSQAGAGGQVGVTTLGGVAQRAVDLYWPVIAAEAGFAEPEHRPTFLSLETAQYFMARLIGAAIEREGYFDTVKVDRNRLYSQLIDNLNKAALIGFAHTEIGSQLKAAWTGDVAQLKVYDDVQVCVDLFRQFCLDHNLLDFSLQVQLFNKRVWELPQAEKLIFGPIKHLIVDNIEEDTPAAHRFTTRLLDTVDTALIVYDTQAGYRRFLGADPINAEQVQGSCDVTVEFTESHVMPESLGSFASEMAKSLHRTAPEHKADPRDKLRYDNYKYQPEMIDGVTELIASLVHDDGVDPKEIVVLSPFLSDALRFSLMNRLEHADVPVRSHRPSRSLREEPASRALLTLAQVAHPEWRANPTQFDLLFALVEAIEDLDLVRGQLLTRHAYRIEDRQPILLPFEQVRGDVQERVTFVVGERYDRLREWIGNYIAESAENGGLPLDHFFSRLFGEVLSQPGFGLHNDFDAADVTANLIDSAQRFRWIIDESGARSDEKSIGQEYVEMVAQGVIASQYLRSWEMDVEENAVLLAPAYTFLMSNRPVDYQFWLNVGGRGWAERLYQPLTNPYVLSAQWDVGRPWTDADEVRVSEDALFRLTIGLARRCRQQIYLGFSELGEQGYEQRGELLGAIQRMLRRLPART